MNPTDPGPLDAELLALLEPERARPELPEVMRARILRGVERKLGLAGGSGGGGHGTSSNNNASGGPDGATGGSAIGASTGSGLAGLLGGLVLLAACLGGEGDRFPQIAPEGAFSQEIVAAWTAEQDVPATSHRTSS